jgi:PAS domain-containing protein
VRFDVDSKRVLEANGPCQNLLGYTPEAILRLTLYDLGPPSRSFPQIPLSYANSERVTDGARTRALRSHNPLSSVSPSCPRLQNQLR